MGSPQRSQTPYVPSVEAFLRRGDLDQVLLGLTDERTDLGPLEGDGRALGVVLVVGVGVARRLDEPTVVVAQLREPLLGTPPLGVQQRAGAFGCHGPARYPASALGDLLLDLVVDRVVGVGEHVRREDQRRDEPRRDRDPDDRDAAHRLEAAVLGLLGLAVPGAGGDLDQAAVVQVVAELAARRW